MEPPKFSLGIDLGTSNSAMAVTELEDLNPRVVEVTQVSGPNQRTERRNLPSALYIPHPDEFTPESIRLPWEKDDEKRPLVGQFARDHGAQVPDRLVSSAKSWLSHAHVDPHEPILPWKSPIDEPKVSPLEASTQYLRHLKEALLEQADPGDSAPAIADYTIVLTVPASFDEAARNLTLEAATAAGLGEVTLLEEPQAAFYAWTAHSQSNWREQVSPGDIVLVCDVGGGTADFSLLAITDEDGSLGTERISVGEHILLGGDNMDLALAYTLRAQLESEGKTIDDWQFLALTHAAGKAKTQLFADESLEEVPITLPSRGSSLLRGALSTKLTRSTLGQVVIDGFLALTDADDLPAERSKTALSEFGLNYAADPVISKHLARFLRRSLQNVIANEQLRSLVRDADLENADFLRPTSVLFNGGVFNATPIRNRVLELLARWNQGTEVRELSGFEPDLAVAKGAAVYGRVRQTGEGLRIRAGTARSYYVGLESTMPAVPGFVPPVKAICIVPQGMEEGCETSIEDQQFGLTIGQAAEFQFFTSEVRSGDTPGHIIANASQELEQTNAITITLPPGDRLKAGDVIPVRIHATVSERGTLQLWMHHNPTGERWNLDYQVSMS